MADRKKPWAIAYEEEYGPRTAGDDVRVQAFRFGYEAGHRDGVKDETAQIIRVLARRQETR